MPTGKLVYRYSTMLALLGAEIVEPIQEYPAPLRVSRLGCLDLAKILI